MKLYTFRKGGIHPHDHKISSKCPIKDAGIPSQVTILLSQHIGAPAQAVVKKGDSVKVGTLIAVANGMISSPVHSSVSGKVNRIDMQIDASGYKRQAIVIDVEGDEWEESIDRSETLVQTCNLSSEEILKKIEDAGIVGMGGAAFPTCVKLRPPKGFKAEVLLINGAECEPYLTNDHRLMLEKGEELLVGARILMKALNVTQTYIGIEANKRDAIEYLSKLTSQDSSIKVIALKCKYPQGSEKHLIDAILKKRVKSGALPISEGAVVQNVSTVVAVYEAVQKNKPLFERIVTVTGKGLKCPSNYRVRIGTSYQYLIDLSGGIPEDTGKIISGGPMMGKAVYDTSIPVTKGSSGILLFARKDSVRKQSSECIRCAKCLEACPMGLNPTFLMTLTEFKQWDKAEKEMVTDCIECGSCSFTCPANRPLLDFIRLGKSTVMTNIRNRKSNK